jgi:hypothetical protein
MQRVAATDDQRKLSAIKPLKRLFYEPGNAWPLWKVLSPERSYLVCRPYTFRYCQMFSARIFQLMRPLYESTTGEYNNEHGAERSMLRAAPPSRKPITDRF